MKNGEYEMVVPPKEYPGKLYRGRYAYEHHVVWWKRTGEILKSGSIIHHKNGNKRDNSFKNLEILSNSDHSIYHGLERTAKSMIQLKCEWCGICFERGGKHVRYKLKIQTRFFCCRSHQVHYQQKFLRKKSF